MTGRKEEEKRERKRKKRAVNRYWIISHACSLREDSSLRSRASKLGPGGPQKVTIERVNKLRVLSAPEGLLSKRRDGRNPGGHMPFCLLSKYTHRDEVFGLASCVITRVKQKRIMGYRMFIMSRSCKQASLY